MSEPKTLTKNVKNIEKIFQLMKKYQVSAVKVDGLEIVKNYHELPEPKKKDPEKNGSQTDDPLLKELEAWEQQTLP